MPRERASRWSISRPSRWTSSTRVGCRSGRDSSWREAVAAWPPWCVNQSAQRDNPALRHPVIASGTSRKPSVRGEVSPSRSLAAPRYRRRYAWGSRRHLLRLEPRRARSVQRSPHGRRVLRQPQGAQGPWWTSISATKNARRRPYAGQLASGVPHLPSRPVITRSAARTNCCAARRPRPRRRCGGASHAPAPLRARDRDGPQGRLAERDPAPAGHATRVTSVHPGHRPRRDHQLVHARRAPMPASSRLNR
jgi:hypothetical protein